MSDTEKDQLDPMTKGTHGDIEQHDGDIPVKTEDTGDSHFQSESSNESLEHVSPQEPFASHHSAQYPFVKLDQQQQMQQLFQHQMLQMQQQQHLHQQQQSGSNIPMDAFLSSISSGFPSPSMSPDLNVQQQQMAMAAAAAQAVSLNMASLRYPNGFPLMMPTGSLAPGHPSSTSPTDPSSTLSSCGTPVKMETASPSMGSFNYQNHPVDGGSKYPFGPIVSQQRINSHNHPGSPPTSPFMTEEDAQQQAMAMSPSLDMSALSQGSFHPSSFPKSLFKTPMNYAPSIRRDSIGSSMGSLTAGELAMLDKEKPFKCPYPGCEARFPRMYNLKSHSLCHTGMLFVCVCHMACNKVAHFAWKK